jgi:hypothetical protein
MALPLLIPILYPIIVWLAQAGLTAAGFYLIDKMGDAILEAIREHYGLAEDDARIALANNILDIAAFIGVGSKVMASKIPLKLADKLGIRAGGFAKKKLSVAGEAKVKAKTLKDPKGKALGGLIWKKVRGMSTVNWLMVLMVGQGIGDWFMFARPTLQKTLRDVTGIDDLELPGGKSAPPGFSDAKWEEYLNAIESAGVVGISNEAARQSQLYTREGMVQLATFIYGREAAAGKSTTETALQKALAPFLKMKGATAPLPSSPRANISSAPLVAPQNKVFTGVVSQGTVGGSTKFVARQDDLIESISELQQAINNNVSAYLASLLGKVTYEIKVVSSVIVNGLKKTGTAHQLQTGTYSDGRPKYKTVVNKFAVADLYLITERGTRSKLTSIVLGPTDALKFQPTGGDLVNVAAAVPGNILTNNTDEIDTIISNTPTTTLPPASADALVSQPGKGYCFIYDGYKGQMCFNTATIDRLRKEIVQGKLTVEEALAEVERRHLRDFGGTGEDAWANDNPNVVMNLRDNAFAIQTVKDMLTVGVSVQSEYAEKVRRADTSPPGEETPVTAQSDSNIAVPTTSLPSAALSASTLYEFYSSQNQRLPSLADRGVLYQSLGLGQAAFYTGTAEQNTKLLLSLQGKSI